MGFDITNELTELRNKKLNQIDFKSPKELEVRRLDPVFAHDFISRHHYSKTCPQNIGLALGFYFQDILTTCIIYGIPVGRSLAQSIWEGGTHRECWELVRLFSHDNCIKNTESYCIGQSFKYIKQNFPTIKVLVSYSDSKHSHFGYVYQATNWMYIGEGGDKQEFYLFGNQMHTRTANAKFGHANVSVLKEKFGQNFTQCKAPPKYKYVYILRDKKEIMKKRKFEIFPYPKPPKPEEIEKPKRRRNRSDGNKRTSE